MDFGIKLVVLLVALAPATFALDNGLGLTPPMAWLLLFCLYYYAYYYYSIAVVD